MCIQNISVNIILPGTKKIMINSLQNFFHDCENVAKSNLLLRYKIIKLKITTSILVYTSPLPLYLKCFSPPVI